MMLVCILGKMQNSIYQKVIRLLQLMLIQTSLNWQKVDLRQIMDIPVIMCQ